MGDPEVRGFSSCQESLDDAIARAQAAFNDPLVFPNGDQCVNAVLWSPTPPNYSLDYRRTWDFPTTPNRAFNMAPACPPGSGLTFDSARGWHCSASDVVDNVGYCPDCERKVGNPVNAGFGNKFQSEIDYAGSGPFPLRLERVHNSARGNVLDNRSGFVTADAIAGSNWTHNYVRRLVSSGPTQGNDPKAPIVSPNTAAVSRPDGKQYAFNLVSGVWTSDADQKGERLEKLASGWKLTTSDDEVETYDEQGNLVSIANLAGLTQTLSYIATGVDKGLLATVTDPFGRTLAFNYVNRQLVSVTIPGGGQIAYGYTNDTHKQLQTVTYPDSSTRTYHYEGPVTGGYKRMLTGITDELGVRYATWVYDYDFFNSASAGAPVLSQHAGGAGKVTISYAGGAGAAASVTTYVTPTVSATRTYTFQNNLGVFVSSAITGPACPECGAALTTYNGTNRLVSGQTDWNGVRSARFWDTTRNLVSHRLIVRDADGTTYPESVVIRNTWHPTFRLPTVIREPLRTTTNTYDPDGTLCGARGALCSKSIQATTDYDGDHLGSDVGAPRVWTYTYNANGQVLTADGPRTDVVDVTNYTYDAQGNVATIANALGHTTQIPSYNVHGQPLTIIDPNGLTTTLSYDARQRLTSRSVAGETTGYEYNLAGLLTKVTLPDSSFLSYGYDGAHRLTSITDNLGNRIQYTLDLAGNRTKEEVFDPLNALQQTKSRVYSSINRLFQELGALNQTTEYTYDNQGNVLTVKDPLNRITTNAYDRRNRLKQVTDPATGVAQYGYNGLSALVSVTDPRNLVTTYALNGLGNMDSQVSPDTGTTANTYDAAGNLAIQTDAKGQVTSYAYDALNRVSRITFHDGSKQAYAYDSGANGLGRLSSITETNPSNVVTSAIAYAYDPKGRVTAETRTVNGVAYVLAYSYDASGRLAGMAYPSGRSVAYGFDALGRVNQVTTTKDAQTLLVVQNVQYHPFGGAKSWTLGNGQIYARAVDADGRIASYTLGGTNNAITYDAASRITAIATNTYSYDNLDRLASAILPSSNYAYSYDAVGNRLTKTTGANNDTYTYSATSNRIATLTPFGSPARNFVFDANGSTTNDGLNGYAYDTRGRMVQSTNAASLVTGYQVNALGQRIRKTNANEDRVFTYDTWGKLIAESDPGGTPKREYLYLGDIPVGVLQ